MYIYIYRYPVSGNLTVRTVGEEPVKLSRGQTLPVGTPVHFHMWTLQNSSREWDRPHEFIPERWSSTSTNTDTSTSTATTDKDIIVAKRQHPTCPFLSSASSSTTTTPTPTTTSSDYDSLLDGAGFSENGLSYFPFSAGNRSCPAKGFVFQVIKKVLINVILTYRFEAFEVNAAMENDPGQSNNAIVVSYLI